MSDIWNVQELHGSVPSKNTMRNSAPRLRNSPNSCSTLWIACSIWKLGSDPSLEQIRGLYSEMLTALPSKGKKRIIKNYLQEGVA